MQSSPAGLADMAGAGINIEALPAEGAYRAGREAGLGGAALARRSRRGPGRQVDGLGKGQRRAVSVPQPMLGMNEDPQRRREHCLRPLRPALERPIGRPAERIDRRRAGRSRKIVDHTPRPAIERIGSTVACLRRTGKERPDRAADIADEDQRRRRLAIAPRWHAIDCIGTKAAAKSEPGCGKQGCEFGKLHGAGGILWLNSASRNSSAKTMNTQTAIADIDLDIPTLEEIAAARRQLDPYIVETPVHRWRGPRLR